MGHRYLHRRREDALQLCQLLADGPHDLDVPRREREGDSQCGGAMKAQRWEREHALQLNQLRMVSVQA